MLRNPPEDVVLSDDSSNSEEEEEEEDEGDDELKPVQIPCLFCGKPCKGEVGLSRHEKFCIEMRKKFDN